MVAKIIQYTHALNNYNYAEFSNICGVHHLLIAIISTNSCTYLH